VDATLIIANVPFAMIGGVFALLSSGIPLSVSTADWYRPPC
jgi:cobalt-zinc-cadmium resistance protein CzcA